MKVMVTGIAGTIGTAFATYLHNTDHMVFGIDRNEEAAAQFAVKFPGIPLRIGDYDHVDLTGMDVVIHLAAMKHIDLCEANPNEAVFNNLLRLFVLLKEAKNTQTDIIFMSTDKAVEPTSVYGYTKALGEAMVWEYGGRIVRSGNVIDSNGSVFEIWDRAIAMNQPVKITHPDMRRFFIEPENLVKQIWQQYLEGRHLIIPKMDRDVLLVEILKEKLAVAGYSMEDYPGGIEYIGLRPGEKLEEKLEWQK